MASLADDGSQGNGHADETSLSADGSRIAFFSAADNLVAGDSNGKATCIQTSSSRHWLTRAFERLPVTEREQAADNTVGGSFLLRRLNRAAAQRVLLRAISVDIEPNG